MGAKSIVRDLGNMGQQVIVSTTPTVLASCDKGHVFCIGSGAISDGAVGYAPACIYLDVVNQAHYRNAGTKASSNFDAVTLN